MESIGRAWFRIAPYAVVLQLFVCGRCAGEALFVAARDLVDLNGNQSMAAGVLAKVCGRCTYDGGKPYIIDGSATTRAASGDNAIIRVQVDTTNLTLSLAEGRTYAVVGPTALDTPFNPSIRPRDNADITDYGTDGKIVKPFEGALECWTAPCLVKVMRTDSPQSFKSPTLTAAKREWESFHFVMRSTRPITSVKVYARDITGPGTISKVNIMMHRQHYVTIPHKHEGGEPAFPDALIPYEGPFSLAENTTTPLLVTIKVPPDAQSGDYRGVIVVEDDDGRAATYPFALHVYNFSLPPQFCCSTAFGIWDIYIDEQYNYPIGAQTPQSVETYKNYYKLQLDYVCPTNLPWLLDLNSPEGANLVRDPRVTTFQFPPWLNGNSSQRQAAAALLRSLEVFHKVFVYVYDEPYRVDHMQHVINYARQFHADCGRDLRTLVTISDDLEARPMVLGDIGYREVSAWSGNGVEYPKGSLVYYHSPWEYAMTQDNNYIYRALRTHTSNSANGPMSDGPFGSWHYYWEQVYDHKGWESERNYAEGDVVWAHAHNVIYNKPYLFRCVAAHTSSPSNKPKTGNWQTYWKHYSPLEFPGADEIDCWCHGIRFWENHAEQLAALKAKGKQLWYYTTGNSGTGVSEFFVYLSPMYVRIMQWQGYKYNCEGHLYWATNYWTECERYPENGPPNPWHDACTIKREGLCGEGVLIYPGAQLGTTTGYPSLRLIYLRDSIEDYQYLRILEAKSGRAAAMAFVDQLVASWSIFSLDHMRLSAVREQLAAAIEAP